MEKIKKEIVPYILILVIVVLIRAFIVTPVTVVGSSMYPNLKDGEILLLSKVGYKLKDIERFDVVVIKEDDWIIKRIIGLPGDNVYYKDNELYINDKLVEDKNANGITGDFDLNSIWEAGINEGKKDFDESFDKIPEGYYLVLGDNRGISKDSRDVGLINKNKIKGKAIFRFWPLNKISGVK